MESKRIGFIGAGNMAEAIAKGMISSSLVPCKNIIASATSNRRLCSVWNEMGTVTTLQNEEVVLSSDVIFLSVKPHILPNVLDQIIQISPTSDDFWKNKLFVSIAAGVTLDFIEGKLNIIPNVKVIRTMPNTPCLVQSGVIVYSLGKYCSEDDGLLLERLMQVTGIVEKVDEKHIDAMSSIMGCSIAWFYNVIEGMSDGAVKNGVPRNISYRLVSKAMEGAAKMVLETGKHVGQLKDEVTSPNGSTICGVYELEQAGVRGIFMRAVQAATERNRALGQQ